MDPSTALPGLDAVAIDRLAASWQDGGLWRDVQWLADQFLQARGERRTVAWHHLVLAVGNFKRQSGRRLHPALVSDTTFVPRSIPASSEVPGCAPAVTVAIEDSDSWEELERALSGAAVATTTTLLAALWAKDHFVFDWRVRAAANGLRVAAQLPPAEGIDPDATDARPVTFADYGIVRRWVLDTAASFDRSTAAIERALYRLSQETAAPQGPRTWRAYGDATLATLERIGAPFT